MDVSDDGEVFGRSRENRRESVDSIDQELDWLIKKEENKNNLLYAPDNKITEEEEDNISEEKVKQELDQNEKGQGRLTPTSDLVETDRAASSPESDRWSSPEPLAKKFTSLAPSRDKTKALNEEWKHDFDGNVIQPGSVMAGLDTSDMNRPNLLDRATSRQNDSYEDEDDLESFDLSDDMSDDQKKAMLELHHMKLDLAYTEDDPPEYDVAERVRQLNEELAKDPTPLEDERERSIKFKDNLIDLVAPPPDYPSDEEDSYKDNRASGDMNNAPADVLRMERMNIHDHEPNGKGDEPSFSFHGPEVERTKNESTKHTEEGGNKSLAKARRPPNGDQNVLVERDGKFELVNAKDLTAEERSIFLPPPSDEEDMAEGVGLVARTQSNGSSSSDGSYQPVPPQAPRPATASATQQRRHLVVAPKRRVQSAKPAAHALYGDFNYNSPYALSKEDKDLGQKQRKHKEHQKQKESDLERMENDQKKRENEQTFQAWLRNKRLEHRRPVSTENDSEEAKKKEKEEKDKEAEGAFKEWLKLKYVQKRREKVSEDQKKREFDEGWYERPRDDCDKAFRQYVFKEWLKKKNQDTRKAKKQEVSRTRIHRLLVRRTRKSMQLARAIKESQSFRYVDYYGYRC